jgi:2-polyprenyl-6-hydroxyphenyl methylase/3-demethylubiquinone-9 3-methyltransferase
MASLGNADTLEIAHFDRLAEVWWDQHGEMRTLHVINPLRLDFIRDDRTLSNLAVLDVGCGGGILTEALARAGAHVTGIDLSQSSITVAEQHAQSQGLPIEYYYSNVEDFAQKHEASYDIVTCMELLEHVPQPGQVIAACAQALKPGGQAYFSTINRTPKAFLFAILIGEYVLHLLPRGSHKYRRLIRFQEMKVWAVENGLAFMRLASLMYNPLTGKFKLAAQKEDVNYMAQFTRQALSSEKVAV